jgi:hypothetical protein
MRKYSKRQFIYSSIAWLYAEQNPTQIILLQVAYPGNVMERLRKKTKSYIVQPQQKKAE